MNVEFTVNVVCDVFAEGYGADGLTDDIRLDIAREVERRIGIVQCQAMTRLGRRCSRSVHAASNEFWRQHDPNTCRCGALIRKGVPCQRLVRNPGDKCRQHDGGMLGHNPILSHRPPMTPNPKPQSRSLSGLRGLRSLGLATPSKEKAEGSRDVPDRKEIQGSVAGPYDRHNPLDTYNSYRPALTDPELIRYAMEMSRQQHTMGGHLEPHVRWF